MDAVGNDEPTVEAAVELIEIVVEALLEVLSTTLDELAPTRIDEDRPESVEGPKELDRSVLVNASDWVALPLLAMLEFALKPMLDELLIEADELEARALWELDVTGDEEVVA